MHQTKAQAGFRRPTLVCGGWGALYGAQLDASGALTSGPRACDNRSSVAASKCLSICAAWLAAPDASDVRANATSRAHSDRAN